MKKSFLIVAISFVLLILGSNINLFADESDGGQCVLEGHGSGMSRAGICEPYIGDFNVCRGDVGRCYGLE